MAIKEELRTYFKHFGWSASGFSTLTLKEVVVASILEYLYRKISLEFVLHLGNAIRNQTDIKLDNALLAATATLGVLSKQLAPGKQDTLTDEEIEEQLCNALDSLTR